MAGVTLGVRLHMVVMFTSGSNPIVAARADSCSVNGSMIKADIRPGIGRVMAGITLFRGLYMSRVLAGCRATVMTA